MSSEAEPVTTFEWIGGRSGKVRCTVCGRTGWGSLDPRPSRWDRSWQQTCLAGHPHRCVCGRRFANLSAIATHVRKAREPGPHGRA